MGQTPQGLGFQESWAMTNKWQIYFKINVGTSILAYPGCITTTVYFQCYYPNAFRKVGGIQQLALGPMPAPAACLFLGGQSLDSQLLSTGTVLLKPYAVLLLGSLLKRDFKYPTKAGRNLKDVDSGVRKWWFNFICWWIKHPPILAPYLCPQTSQTWQEAKGGTRDLPHYWKHFKSHIE